MPEEERVSLRMAGDGGEAYGVPSVEALERIALAKEEHRTRRARSDNFWKTVGNVVAAGAAMLMFADLREGEGQQSMNRSPDPQPPFAWPPPSD